MAAGTLSLDSLAAARAAASGSPEAAPPAAAPSPASVAAPTVQAASVVPQSTGLDDALVGGGAGALNGLLFGFPEYAIKHLGGKQWADDFIARHKTAYDVGNIAGSIGSAFIPVAGIAGKAAQAGLLGAKAAEAANAGRALLGAGKGAEALAGAANTASQANKLNTILSLAGKGAIAGGAEGAARGFFGANNSEGTLGESLQGATQGLTQGAGLGAVGGGIGGAVSSAAPRIANILKKYTEKSVIGTTDAKARQLIQMVDQMSNAGAGPGAKLANSDELRGQFVDFIKANKLWKEGAIEDAYQQNKAIWDKLDNVYDDMVGNKPAAEVLQGGLGPDDTEWLLGKYSPETLAKAQDDIVKQFGQSSGMANIRDRLRTISRNAQKLNSGNLADADYANAVHDVASTLRSNLDNAVVKAAEDSGANIPPTFKRDWGFLQPLEKGALRADWTPNTGGMGSPTFEKAMVGSLIPGGVIGFANGGDNGDIGTRLGNAAIGSLGGLALAKGLGAGRVKTGALLDTLAGKAQAAAPNIAANAPGAAMIGGGLASLAAPQGASPEQAAPQNAQASLASLAAPAAVAQSATAAAQGSPEHQAEFNTRLTEGINRAWIMQTQGTLGPADPSNPEYANFVKTIDWSLRNNGQSDTVNPKLAANLLFPDPNQRKDYLSALDAVQRISGALGSVQGGPLGQLVSALPGNEQAQAARGSVIDAAKSLGGDAKATEAAVNRILNSSKSKQEKLNSILSILQKNNPNATQALGLAGI